MFDERIHLALPSPPGLQAMPEEEVEKYQAKLAASSSLPLLPKSAAAQLRWPAPPAGGWAAAGLPPQAVFVGCGEEDAIVDRAAAEEVGAVLSALLFWLYAGLVGLSRMGQRCCATPPHHASAGWHACRAPPRPAIPADHRCGPTPLRPRAGRRIFWCPGHGLAVGRGA